MPAEGAGIRFGHYVLLRRLARGGMAEVFLAEQRLEGFERRVAIKRILPHLVDAPDFVKMFLSEAKLAAQLTHPNIVHIYDFGKVESDYFIAMELVDGVHAGDLFKRPEGDRLSPTMIARIGADAASALHYAHELRASNGKPYGLVHRDVSPANLMVTFDGAVKLCDFGIAKAAALGEQLTLPGHVKGKYAYMSPEQTTGSPLDGRSDVYALAIVLWELLAGKTIVGRGDAVEAMRAIRDGKLTPIDRVAPWTPPALARAITRALTTNRDQRPTAIQLAQELEAFIKSSPELGSPLELGSWLRTRFPREPVEDGPSVTGTVAGPATGSSSVDRLADAATVIASDDPVRDLDDLGDEGPDHYPDDDDETNDPEQGFETIMRSNVFRAQIAAASAAVAAASSSASQHPSFAARTKSPTSPPAAPTLYDPRANSAPGNAPVLATPASGAQAQPPYEPAFSSGPRSVPPSSSIAQTLLGPGSMRASPMAGLPAMPGVQPVALPPVAPGPQIPRRALAIGGLVGLAVLSFIVVLASRSSRPPFAIAPPGDAAIAVADAARPVDAAPAIDAAPPVDAARPPPDAFVPTITPEPPVATTVLEIRTRPDGAAITIAGDTRTSPAQFTLPAGHYPVDAEHDGWLPEHRELDLTAGTRVVQDIVFTHRVRPPKGTGKHK